MSNVINTNFADDSGPGKEDVHIFRGLGLIAALFMPLTIVSAVVTYLLFSYGRIHYKVIAGFIGIYAAILLVFGLFDNALWSYIYSFYALPRLFDEFTVSNVLSVVVTMMLMQAPLSILVGGVIGTVRSWWAWFRRPVWKQYRFRKTPAQLWKKRRNIKDIRNDRATPPDGRTIGVTEDGERVNQSEREGRAHTVVMGASGSGKTTTILNGARDQIKRGEGVVFVDMKGSTDVPEVLAMYAKRYGRPFRHWTATESVATYDGPATDGPSFYDPLSRGDATRKTNLLVAGRKWEGNADHYKFIVQNYLQKAFEVLNATPELNTKDSFADILNLLDPATLKARSLKLNDKERQAQYAHDPALKAQYDQIIEEIGLIADRRLDPQMGSTLNSMRSQYGALAQSIQGRWLKQDPNPDKSKRKDINLFDAAHQGEVVVFSIDSSNYEENSRILGNFIIQDLKTVSSELRHDPSRYPLNVIIDEFAAIGSDNIINLINKSRDAKMPVTLSTQSLGDLRTVSNAFMDQLTGIVSSFIIHRANGYDDAEVYAALTPRIKKTVFRQAVSHSTNLFGGIGRGSGTGKGTVDEVDAHLIDPSDIQSLKAGEAFYICKDPSRLARVQVYTEAENIASDANDGKANGAYDAAQEATPLLLNEGENLSDYSYVPSDNYTRSMEEQRQEQAAEEAKTYASAQRRADPSVLNRVIGGEHLKEISVKKDKVFGDAHEPTVTRPAPAMNRPLIRPVLPVLHEPDVDELESTFAPNNDMDGFEPSVGSMWDDDGEPEETERAPVQRPVRQPPNTPAATAQSGSTSWENVASKPGRPPKSRQVRPGVMSNPDIEDQSGSTSWSSMSAKPSTRARIVGNTSSPVASSPKSVDDEEPFFTEIDENRTSGDAARKSSGGLPDFDLDYED